MEETKVPEAPPSEEWAALPWRKLEQHLYRLQKRIFKASARGDLKTVHQLQKLLMKSRSARLVAVRRVTQENQGKKTAGVDGVKSVPPAGRLALAEAIHPNRMNTRKPKPLRRVWIPKPGKAEQRPLGIPVMSDRAGQALAKLALEPQWEALFEADSYGFRPGRSAHDAIAAIIEAYRGEKKTLTTRKRAPKLIRYADDFVVLHTEEVEVMKAQQLIATWLQGLGLELKPSKTRLSHTLNDYQGNVGFNFLGFAIRQFPVGKTHTGASKGKPLGFKTIITPSKEAVQRHVQALRTILQKSASLSQEELIDQLNPVIHGWSLYYRTVVSKKRFAVCDCVLMHMLWQKMTRKHPKKGAKWVKEQYWRTIKGNTWTFAASNGSTMRTLRRHVSTPIQRHIKVKGQASPFDGNLLYWAKRLQHHPLTKTTLGKLLQKQQGKCRWCELLFREEVQIEIDHLTPKSEGGNEELSNKCALHRHCHDQRHAKHEAKGISHN